MKFFIVAVFLFAAIIEANGCCCSAPCHQKVNVPRYILNVKFFNMSKILSCQRVPQIIFPLPQNDGVRTTMEKRYTQNSFKNHF